MKKKSVSRSKPLNKAGKARSTAAGRNSENLPAVIKAAAPKKAVSKKSTQKKAAQKKTTATKPVRAVVVKRITRKLNKQLFLDAYREMLRSRLVDQKIITLYKQNKCHFQIGVAGHECVQVAAAFSLQASLDWFYPYYRDMALVGGLGMSNREFFLNAMNKQADPNSHGRQMPMHYGHVGLNIVNQSSPTGTQFLQAVGSALVSQLKKLDEVTYVSSGEGACSQGDFHEAINWAARDKLPIIFLIQNNGYAISVPVAEQLAGESVSQLVSGYSGLVSYNIDGTDFAKSFETMQKAVARARSGKGPTLIEANVPRLQSHSISDNQLKYRSTKELEGEMKRCPVVKITQYLLKKKLANKAELEAIEEALRLEINADAEWAEEQADPDPATALDYTFSDNQPDSRQQDDPPAEGEVTYIVDSLNHALAEEMERDPNCYVFGQDVAGGKGGVFTVTSGLTDRFGADRCFNSQLAESSIVGVAIGMATRGLKPIAEVQFGDYIWTASMQIRNELAMLHYRSGGDFSCPVVLRIPVGGYIHGAAYHSQCIEATFAHYPGLYVVMPSNATDAKGLLKSAIRSNNPVLFLEHKGLYRQVYAKGPEGDADALIALGKARIVQPGNDLTIITWGALVQKSLMAAQALADQGLSVEVIDLRTIVPLDRETIFESVRRTGRALIAHEDVVFMGFGAELAAQIADECFASLDAPVKRVGMKYAAAVPHSPGLEAVILPQIEDIIQAAKDLLIF